MVGVSTGSEASSALTAPLSASSEWNSDGASSGSSDGVQAVGGKAPWNKENAIQYSIRMLWEQIRTVLPIFAFLIGYLVRCFCVCVCVRVRVCARVRACVRARVRACVCIVCL